MDVITIQQATLLENMKDPKWYIENFCKIKGKTPGLQPFKLNPAQTDLFNALNTSTRVIILKARQIGFSTAAVAYLYHKAITTPGVNVAVIGYNNEVVAEILDKVKTFWHSTPEAYRPKIQYNSKHEISFPVMDSKIFVLPSSDQVGRGYTIHYCLLTELAFWDKPESKMLAIENAVPSSGLIIIESTPNGIGNLYHRMWCAKDNGYVKKKYGWWWGYNEEQIEAIRRRINDPMRFAQEYTLEFLATGRPVFSPDLVKRLRKGILNLGEMTKTKEGVEYKVNKTEEGLIMYYAPDCDHKYVVGADVSEGITGGDYSVAVIWDKTTGEEVAYWRGLMAPDKFGLFLNQIGRYYNNALMTVEINNHGISTVDKLKEMLYPQMYFRPTKFDSVSQGWGNRMGWKTGPVTKPLMIDDLNEALRDGELIPHTDELLNEMLTFVYDENNNTNAQFGFHDDVIMASAVCFQGFKIVPMGDMGQVRYQDHLPSSGY
jgi:hypothetical protein